MGVDDTLGILRALFPPSDNASPRQVRVWRQNLALILGGSVIMNVVHIAWACGFLAFMGLPGFVRADDLSTIHQQQVQLANQFNGIQQDQKAIRENQLDVKVQQAREKQCHAIATSNSDAKSFATDKLQESLSQYYRLMGRPYYRLPDCSEL